MNNTFSFQQTVSNMERDLLFHIIMNSRTGKLSRVRAQEIARIFIRLKQNNDPAAMFATIARFIRESCEFHEIFVTYAPVYYDFEREQQLHHIRTTFVKGGGE